MKPVSLVDVKVSGWISPEPPDCPLVFPRQEIRHGVTGDGPQVGVLLVGDGGQTIQPGPDISYNTDFTTELTYLDPSGRTSGWSSFNSTSRFLISF